MPGPYGKSDYPGYPCDAFWTSPVQWELDGGPDSLHGEPSDASVSVEFTDFPDAGVAKAEFAKIRTISDSEAAHSSNGIPMEVIPVNATGDAEAFLAEPTEEFFHGTYFGSVSESQLFGRCGARLLRVSVAKDSFYSAIMGGHSPDEENIVQRSRLPQRVDKELKAAYAQIGVPLCAQEDPPATVIGPWQPLDG